MWLQINKTTKMSIHSGAPGMTARIWGRWKWRILRIIAYWSDCSDDPKATSTSISEFFRATQLILPCSACRNSFDGFLKQSGDICEIVSRRALVSHVNKLQAMVSTKLMNQVLGGDQEERARGIVNALRPPDDVVMRLLKINYADFSPCDIKLFISVVVVNMKDVEGADEHIRRYAMCLLNLLNMLCPAKYKKEMKETFCLLKCIASRNKTTWCKKILPENAIHTLCAAKKCDPSLSCV